MKKINVFFLSRVFDGVAARKGLVIFAMLFLFGFGYNTVNAQYVSSEVAIQKLTAANIQIMNNWEALQQSENTVEIQKATMKQGYLRAMIADLKGGLTVNKLVDKWFVKPNSTQVQGFQLTDDPKFKHENAIGLNNAWLNGEILEMLEL